MAPAQPFTEFDQDCKSYINPELELDTENRTSLANSAAKGSAYVSNCEETAIRMESISNGKDKGPMCIDDLDIDIIECRNNYDSRLQDETDDPNATEYSSSFADTISDNEIFSGFSDGEVQSQFTEDNGLTSSFDAFTKAFQMRKKKLTNHWRNFIRPLMWRCKWMELRVKEIESQELKYSRELAVACDQRKQSGLDQFTLDDFGSKSFPFSSQLHRKKAMKRRKRKRVEETTDMASYMSHHNVFSYLENKRSDPDSTSLADEFSNAVITEHSFEYNDKLSNGDDWSFFEFRDGDKSLEQVLWSIERMHSRVHKLKNQIDVVMSKNAARFSSFENLNLLITCDAQTSSAHSPALSAGNGDTMSHGAIYSAQHISEYNIGDMVMPESAVSSFGEAITVPDMIESTVGLLSAIEDTFHQPQFGDSSEDIVDSVLIHNEVAEGVKPTLQIPKEENEHEQQQQQEAENGIQEGPFPTPSSEPDPGDPSVVAEAPVAQEQSTLESCLASDVNFPRNKRKRGERKAGSDVWSKKCSGEADSQ